MKLRLTIIAAFVVLLAGCHRFDYIDLKPTDAVMSRRNQVLQLHARAMDQEGHYYASVVPKFTSSDPSIASVNDKGEVTAHKSGHVWITATADKITAKVQVAVNLVEKLVIGDPEVKVSVEAGEPAHPSITAYDAHGKAVPNRQIFMKSADEKIATVDSSGGIWPQTVGETTVTAKIDGHEGQIHVIVTK